LVRALHVLAYAVLARGNPVLGAAVARLARTILPAVGVLVLAGLFTGPGRVVCWAIALAIDYGGLLLGSTQGWRVEPAHFAERHGLIIIIALGESIDALGVGAAGLALEAGVIGGVVLGLIVAGCLWWAYFGRNVGSFNYPRLVASAALLAHAPIVTVLPALLSLGLVPSSSAR
jgi:low temperature requirement protein LtrA